MLVGISCIISFSYKPYCIVLFQMFAIIFLKNFYLGKNDINVICECSPADSVSLSPFHRK